MEDRDMRFCSSGRALGRPAETLGDKWQERSGQSVCVCVRGVGVGLCLRPARALGQAHFPPSTPNTLGPARRAVRVSGRGQGAH